MTLANKYFGTFSLLRNDYHYEDKTEVINISKINLNGEELNLSKQLQAYVIRSDGLYVFVNKYLEMYCEGETYFEAKDCFFETFFSLKEMFVDCDEDELATSGKELRKKLLEYL